MYEIGNDNKFAKNNRMKKIIILFLPLAFAFTSCTLNSRMMKTPAHYVEFDKDDFTYTEQISAEASSTKILGIDFSRLFNRSVGNIDAPIIGFNPIALLNQYIGDKTVNYALYELFQKNPGYDVIFYPVIERKRFNVLFLYSKTDVKVSVRLGKLKK